ncbi:MAG TPA: hypothetical protein IAA43_00920 [Candidatus Olsenella avicola]|nr:hypothetical protein [Candidatus Olsenella avicola]
MDGNKISILFICGNGMGTSTMMEINIKKALQPYGIRANLQHTSLGQMESLRDWADIIVILKNLTKGLKVREGEHVIEVVNIMDGKGISAKVNDIVEEFFPEAKA